MRIQHNKHTQDFIEHLQAWEHYDLISSKQFGNLKPPQNISTHVIYFRLKVHKKALKVRLVILCTNTCSVTQTPLVFFDSIHIHTCQS